MPFVSRRHFLRLGVAAGAGGLLSRIPSARASGDRPRFLLVIQIQNGVDSTYLFDDRPAKLTDRNLKANYLLRNDLASAPTRPEEFTPERTAARTIACAETGCRAIRSPLADALWDAHRDVLSIVNGVYMLRNSVGHVENSIYFWANAERGGGPIFPPIVGRASAASTPLDAVILRERGSFFAPASNAATSAELETGEVVGLSQTLDDGPTIDEASPAWGHVLARADANAGGGGMFSAGARDLAAALRRARATGSTFGASADGDAPPPGAQSSIASMVRQALGFFSGGLTRVASVVVREKVDKHDATAGQVETVAVYTSIAAEIARALDLLRTTSFVDPSGRATPFVELTTFLITSEFGRTTRAGSFAPGDSVGATGTDHNPLSNFALVGGRGIRPGLVVGESDLRDCDDAGRYVAVSGAHREKNPRLDQAMGKPWDFAAQRVRDDLPARFDERDYITIASLTNTVLDAFDVPESSRFKVGAQVAPILSVLRDRRTT